MICTCSTERRFIGHVTKFIMLIEDDPDHAELIIRTTEEHRIRSQILHFADGKSALDYLFRRNQFSDPAFNPRPHLILLDLHLPGIDGIDILRSIKASDELKGIPVVILTTSAAEHDMRRAYDHHANSYLVKPLGMEEFKELMNVLYFYWLGKNTEPVF